MTKNYLDPEELYAELRTRLTEIMSQKTALEIEEEQVRNDLDLAEQFMKLWRTKNGTATVHTGKPILPIDSDVPLPRNVKRNPPKEMVAAEAVAVITEAGRPLSRQEVFDALKTRGLRLVGKDPQMVLSTMLWRSQDQVVRLPGHGYWPKRLDYRPANYSPNIEQFARVTDSLPEGEIEGPYDL